MIETKDLILLPLEYKDYKDLHKNFWTDEKSASFMLWKPSKNLKDSKEKILEELDRLQKEKVYFFSWSIFLKLKKEIIGRVHLKIDNKNPSIVESIGMGIGMKFANNGYGTQVLSAIINFCFNDLGITEIHSAYFPRNTASEKLQKKFGFVQNGKLFELTRTYNGEIEKTCPLILKKEQFKKIVKK